ncbi:MAG: 4Fe-4S cluster-binding domain-containing protein [Bacteriovoracaceae bacterium]|jgi:MoaA/NifB/PqqE/SkfB family radical SAM enzyme|nr:4Fe-4S cluster-binding domain-containing protein [Bacteriovoracaceae bacterium]
MHTNLFESIHVMPGLLCNFICTHCVNDSGPKQTLKVTEKELEAITHDVAKYAPKSLQFTGGESTFYADEINRIVASHPDIENCSVTLTSNGWYGKSLELTAKTLSQFTVIDEILLSFDVFHGNEAKIEYINNVKSYAEINGIKLVISFCISNPTDLLKAKMILKDVDLPIIYQKVDSVGRAKSNDIGYRYPTFEKEVLEKTCPNIECISYIPQKGFSICCGNIIFNDDEGHSVAHKSVENHLESSFYKRLKEKTFSEILKEENIDPKTLPAHLSSACGLCEYIHCSKA